MNTIRSLGKWWIPLAGLFLILFGIGLLFDTTVPATLSGVLAILSGTLALLST